MNLLLIPKVSVVMPTYNHEKFIKNALESVLRQKTTFDFNVIIADDCSSDATEQIIADILTSHSQKDKVIYLRNSKNKGVTQSWRSVHDSLKSQYFAFCEGDDYWTDDFKLQKQVDFLDANPSFSICFHNAKVSYIDIPQPDYILNETIAKDIFTTDDLIGRKEIWFMATASLMFRTESVRDIPDWLMKSKSVDIPLIILASLKGKIKYLPDIMAVYQKHYGGMSLTDHKDDASFLKNRIYMYRMINYETRFRYYLKLRQNIASYYYLLLSSRQIKDEPFQRFRIGLHYLLLSLPDTTHFKTVLRDHITPYRILKFSRFIKQKIGLIPVESNSIAEG
jgi:glycosyltransferase involved in cell wall biosynthesis